MVQCRVKKREKERKEEGEEDVKHKGRGKLIRDIIDGRKKRGGGREM